MVRHSKAKEETTRYRLDEILARGTIESVSTVEALCLLANEIERVEALVGPEDATATATMTMAEYEQSIRRDEREKCIQAIRQYREQKMNAASVTSDILVQLATTVRHMS